MKAAFFTFAYFLIVVAVQAQNHSTWTAYQQDNSDLIGFKDSSGKVRIEPKFTGLTTARQFDNIIAAMERIDGRYVSYYLTKTGKKVGHDSLYIWDNSPDCESEGFIRFHDEVTDKVGMFDKKGTIAIPAVYSVLSKVRNGLVWAWKGAKKEYWDESKEHYSWVGGQQMLIDTQNQIIIEKFEYKGRLNLFSLEISTDPDKNPIRQYFAGKNNKFYSFIDYEKEFMNWLSMDFIPNLTAKKLLAASMDNVIYSKNQKGWINESKSTFVKGNFELLKSILLKTQKPNADVFVSIDGLNPFMFRGSAFQKYYNNCGEALTAQYPVMDLIINTRTKSDIIHVQDHFEFLRTDEGYRLISVSISNGELK